MSVQEGGITTKTGIGMAIAIILTFLIAVGETTGIENQDKTMKERICLGKNREEHGFNILSSPSKPGKCSKEGFLYPPVLSGEYIFMPIVRIVTSQVAKGKIVSHKKANKVSTTQHTRHSSKMWLFIATASRYSRVRSVQ